MLVLGATSLLNVLGKRKGALRDWIVGLLAKKPARSGYGWRSQTSWPGFSGR